MHASPNPINATNTPCNSIFLCLGVSLLFLGAFYAFPYGLLPYSHPMISTTSPEIVNLYSFVAWLGLAHFVYAYKGQFANPTLSIRRKMVFFSGLVFLVVLLFFIKHLVGIVIFNLVTWVYFFPHFMKAEHLFNKTFTVNNELSEHKKNIPLVAWFTTVTFTLFSFMLFYPKTWGFQSPVLFALGGIIVAVAYRLNVFRLLQHPYYGGYVLLGCFFIAETFVWGTYTKYMHPHFQQGLYLFHVAFASLYHYFRSYYFARNKPTPPSSTQTHRLSLTNILIVNVACIMLAFVSLQYSNPFPLLTFLVDPQYFTVWVLLHLIASDLYPKFNKR
jgi:hypothetical protein